MNKLKELFSSKGVGLSIIGMILGLLAGAVADKKQDLAIDRAVDRRLNERGITQKEDEDEED